MKNKGFTLVELLTVLVILAVILAIAIPITLNVIEDSQKNGIARTAEGFLRAGEAYIQEQATTPGGERNINMDLMSETNTKKLNYLGGGIQRGELVINDDGSKAIYVVKGSWCAVKYFDDDKTYVMEAADINCRISGEKIASCNPNKFEICGVPNILYYEVKDETIPILFLGEKYAGATWSVETIDGTATIVADSVDARSIKINSNDSSDGKIKVTATFNDKTTSVIIPVKPYIPIRNNDDLYEVRDRLTNSYIMLKDLDLSKGCKNHDGCDTNWEPIGGRLTSWENPSAEDVANTFSGNFYGNNKKISNLKINRSDEKYVGLFTHISSLSEEIRDLTITNVNIKGLGFVGALAGDLRTAKVDNVKVLKGVIDGSAAVGGVAGNVIDSNKISNVKADVDATGKNKIGGLFGVAIINEIENCIASGNVTVISSDNMGDAGGFIGHLHNSSATGTTIINGNVATGNVAGKDKVGGFIGGVSYLAGAPWSIITITNNHATGNVILNGIGKIGGFIGTASLMHAKNNYATGNVSSEIIGVGVGGGFAGIISGYDTIAENNFATGDVENLNTGGGFAGEINGGALVENNFAAGSVKNIKKSSGSFAGSLGERQVGALYKATTRKNYSVRKNLSTGTRPQGFAANLGNEYIEEKNYYNVDNPASELAIPKTLQELQQQSTYEGWDFDTVWKMGPSNYPYPVLRNIDFDWSKLNVN